MSLNIPSSLLVKFAPHSEGETRRRRRRERVFVCVRAHAKEVLIRKEGEGYLV